VAAFINYRLEEKVLMKQFPQLAEFFATNPKLAAKFSYNAKAIIWLQNALYGLKQAAHKWQQNARKLLIARGFVPLMSNDAIYRRNSINETIVTYVNDFLLAELNKANLIAIANSLKNDVKFNILGDVDWFLGVRVRRSAGNGDVSLDLDQYFVKALKACNFGEKWVINIPFEPGMLAEIVPYADKATLKKITIYALMVGKFNLLVMLA
jgi:hypothetical protein